MRPRPLVCALASLLALGDVSWAVQVGRIAPRAAVSPLAARVLSVAVGATRLEARAGPLRSATVFVAPHDAPRVDPARPAALPQLEIAAAPAVDPAAPAAEQREDGARRWDAATSAPAEPDAATVGAASAAAPLAAPTREAVAAAARRIPLPRVAAERVRQGAAWTALTALAAVTHAPFDNPYSLALSLGLAVSMGFITAFYVSLAQNESGGWGFGEPPKARPVTDEEKADLRVRVDAFAAEAGRPAPETLTVVENDVLNAFASPNTVIVHGGILDLPRAQQDAVLRHEVAHMRHGDSAWSFVNLFLVCLPPSVALVGGLYGDWRGLMSVPALVASLYLLGRSKKRDEYHADQYAASREGTGRSLAAALREMKRRQDAEDAIAPKSRLEAYVRAWDKAWGRVARLWASHPPIERRIDRLEGFRGGR